MEHRLLFEHAVVASRALHLTDEATINKVLIAVAAAAEKATDAILAANAKDLAKMEATNPKYDRLKLTAERITAIAEDIRQVAQLPSPLQRTLSTTIRPNGMILTKVSVPFGVVGIIYEARPNVTFDVFSLCLKSGNAVILKGGSDAQHSNEAIMGVIHHILKTFGLNPDIATLLPSDHAATSELLHAVGLVDVIIPRGGKQLIDFVRQNATVPIIETGAGICHTYFDEDGDLEKGTRIVNNAKTRRVSVCNALDCLVVHRKRLADLPALCQLLPASNVLVYADAEAYNALQGHYPAELLKHATDESFGTEFLSYAMAVKTVGSLPEALEHIHMYSSKHSECIITENKESAISSF